MADLLVHTNARAHQVMVWVPLSVSPTSPPLGSVQEVMIGDRRVSFRIDGGHVMYDEFILLYGPEVPPVAVVPDEVG